jgi:RNA polymerase sigma-70 factor (ECF subfamily)
MDAPPEAIRWAGRTSRTRRDGPLTPRAERAAVRGALRGDPAALDVLVRAHWPAAYRAAWLIVRDRHAAEDVAQEGFVAAIGALERFDRSRPFGPWLRTIVARRAIDAARSRAVRREDPDGEAGALERVASPAVEPVLPTDELLAAVAALPDDQRQVVVLRHLLDLTPGEIAEATGVPRGTVNSRLRRGLDTLARVLALVLLVALAGFALTAPGRATAEWVQHHLSHVTRQLAPAVRAPSAPTSRYAPLPGGGRMLAFGPRGVFAFGVGTAPRQLLGRVDAAAWSPHGRFAVAVRGIELIAVDVKGRRRWSFAAHGRIRSPAWSPSGFRVAYLTEGSVRVVAGDGSGDHLLARARAVAPAWQRGVGSERLASVDPDGRVVLRDADSGAVAWRTRAPIAGARQLAWSVNGRRLTVLTPRRLTVLDADTGATLARHTAPDGILNVAIAMRPHVHEGYALIRRNRPGSRYRVTIGRPEGVLYVAGRVRAIAWSPRGDWLAADVAGVDGWDLLRLKGRGADRNRTLAAGRDAHLAGWCCA